MCHDGIAYKNPCFATCAGVDVTKADGSGPVYVDCPPPPPVMGVRVGNARQLPTTTETPQAPPKAIAVSGDEDESAVYTFQPSTPKTCRELRDAGHKHFRTQAADPLICSAEKIPPVGGSADEATCALSSVELVVKRLCPFFACIDSWALLFAASLPASPC